MEKEVIPPVWETGGSGFVVPNPLGEGLGPRARPEGKASPAFDEEAHLASVRKKTRTLMAEAFIPFFDGEMDFDPNLSEVIKALADSVNEILCLSLYEAAESIKTEAEHIMKNSEREFLVGEIKHILDREETTLEFIRTVHRSI